MGAEGRAGSASTPYLWALLPLSSGPNTRSGAPLPGLRAVPSDGRYLPKPQLKIPRPSKTDDMQTGQKTHVFGNISVKIKKCGRDRANNLLENI